MVAREKWIKQLCIHVDKIEKVNYKNLRYIEIFYCRCLRSIVSTFTSQNELASVVIQFLDANVGLIFISLFLPLFST